MMWISNKMSLDWKPWKEGERKENEGKNPVLHVTLLDTLWKSSLLSTFGMLLCSIVYFCVGFFSLKEIKMMGKLACHIKLHHMFFYWQGKKKKRSTMLSSKKITTEEMRAATSSDPVPGK